MESNGHVHDVPWTMAHVCTGSQFQTRTHKTHNWKSGTPGELDFFRSQVEPEANKRKTRTMSAPSTSSLEEDEDFLFFLNRKQLVRIDMRALTSKPTGLCCSVVFFLGFPLLFFCLPRELSGWLAEFKCVERLHLQACASPKYRLAAHYRGGQTTHTYINTHTCIEMIAGKYGGVSVYRQYYHSSQHIPASTPTTHSCMHIHPHYLFSLLTDLVYMHAM